MYHTQILCLHSEVPLHQLPQKILLIMSVMSIFWFIYAIHQLTQKLWNVSKPYLPRKCVWVFFFSSILRGYLVGRMTRWSQIEALLGVFLQQTAQYVGSLLAAKHMGTEWWKWDSLFYCTCGFRTHGFSSIWISHLLSNSPWDLSCARVNSKRVPYL